MIGSAIIDPSGRYRYLLRREFSSSVQTKGLGRVLFIMLNPSTAGADTDDATVRRCVSFAKTWGYDGLEIVNLFAYRATEPSDLPEDFLEAVGLDNDFHVGEAMRRADLLVAAWGATRHAGAKARIAAVVGYAEEFKLPLVCLGTTKHGRPRHPLFLSSKVRPQAFDSKVGR